MIENQKIAVVVPAYNEAGRIEGVLDSMPTEVDTVYIVNDQSTDNTAEIVQQKSSLDSRVVLIDLEKNSGVGAAIVRGYQEVIKNGEDIAVVMAGDGQMDPIDFPDIIRPIVEGRADYSKGNRFLRGREELSKIPRHRLFGNLVLSILTKIVSGYWHVSDTQGGYTAINRRALLAVDWSKCYPRYGCPNDYLVRLNTADMRVCDVPITAVYGSEWQSKMKSHKVILPIVLLLIRLFFFRVLNKYAFRHGHPIVLFYALAIFASILSLFLMAYIIVKLIVVGSISQTASIFFGMTTIVSIQLWLNSFEMDYRYNDWLYIHPKS